MNKTTTQALALPKVIGHRGACGYAPENTLISFIKAAEMHVKCVEFDVQLTADNKLIVFHDTDFKRLAGEKINVADIDYAQCSQFDVGSHFSPQYQGQIAPLLDDVLRYLISVNITPNIEVKPNGQNALAIAETLVHLLEQIWPHDRMPPLISSFDIPILESLRGMSQELEIGFLCEELPDNWREITEVIRSHVVIMDHQYIHAETVAAVHGEGYHLACYTLNEIARAKHLFGLGLDAIISDFPDRIFAALK